MKGLLTSSASWLGEKVKVQEQEDMHTKNLETFILSLQLASFTKYAS